MTGPAAPPPAGRGRREGDEPGRRSFLRLDAPLDLELGDQLPDAVLAYETWGTLNARRDNAVLVLHALTGDSHLAGPAGPGHPTAGWWDALVGPGRALDTERWFVVAPNVLGGCRGTTGPLSTAPDGRPWGSRFPRITIRDQVQAESRFADALGIRRWAAVIGGSMGGMRALEWAVGHPDRVGSLLVLAVGAYATADQIGLQTAQVQAVRLDRAFNGGDYYDTPGDGPHLGLGLARRIAHLSYRSENEMAQRFGRDPQEGEDPLDGGRYAIQSYLDHHAEKLARRFDANSYIVLTEAMNHHDVGRGRGGIEAALGRITAPTVVGGIDTDRLYPPYLQEELAKLIPGADGPQFVHSPYGHDAFLIETDQVADLVRRTLRRAEEDMALRHVRGGQLSGDTNQTTGMTRHEAISGKTVGSTKVWMGQTHVAPFSSSGDHHHGEAETAIYVVSGNPVFVFAEGEKEVRIETEPGDYVFVPPYVPHREENPGEQEAVVVIARSSQEGIVVNLPSLWDSADRD